MKMKEKFKLTKEIIEEVGVSVANGWGGELISFEITRKEWETEITYYCIEHGERFYTTMTAREVYEEYIGINGKN